MEKQKKIYVKGLSLKKPHPNAPDFVRFKGSINLPKLREWLKEQKATGNIEGDWVNFDVADPGRMMTATTSASTPGSQRIRKLRCRSLTTKYETD